MLASTVYASGKRPLLILHGLFGSKRNWKRVANDLSAFSDVHVLDLRNHGESFHGPMTFETMTNDLKEYCKSMEQFDLLGHSLGGRIAMAAASSLPSLRNLILLDISHNSKYDPNHSKYVKALRENNFNGVDPFVAKFLKTNYTSGGLRIGLNEIDEFLQRKEIPTVGFKGKTLFLKGSESDYVKEIDKDLFPNSKLVEIKGGHWLQVDNPEEVVRQIKEFLA